MNFTEYLLNEKYFPSVKYLGETYDIYINPSHDDLHSLLKGRDSGQFYAARFIADNVKKVVYIWNADIIHSIMWDKIKEQTHDHRGLAENYNLLPGVLDKTGEINSDTIWTYVTHVEYKDVIQKYFQQDWKWVDKYIPNVNKMIEHYKQKFKAKWHIKDL